MRPQGIKGIDCTSLSSLLDPHRYSYRPILFATPAPTLSRFLESTYHISGVACTFLPNIVNIDMRKVVKTRQPRVIFLGRLDPINRPWQNFDDSRVSWIIRSSKNARCVPRWWMASHAESDFVLVHDDDLMPSHPKVLAWTLDAAAKIAPYAVGATGVILKHQRGYWDWP